MGTQIASPMPSLRETLHVLTNCAFQETVTFKQTREGGGRERKRERERERQTEREREREGERERDLVT